MDHNNSYDNRSYCRRMSNVRRPHESQQCPFGYNRNLAEFRYPSQYPKCLPSEMSQKAMSLSSYGRPHLVRKLVDDALKLHPIVVFTLTHCPHCRKLFDQMNEAGIPYYKYDFENAPYKKELAEELKKRSGISTVPQVFLKGRFLGDGSTTREMINNGELQRLIICGPRYYMSAGLLVQESLRRSPVVMFTFTYCPACKTLSQWMEKHGIPHDKVDVNGLPNSSQMMQELKKLSGWNSVPQVYVNGEFIGGSEEICELMENGGMEELIGASCS